MSDESKAADHAGGNNNLISAFGSDLAAKGDAESALAVKAAVSIRLRLARETLGLSLREVAARTRITFRYIEILEAGDYASLPGRPYVLGFARGYAQVVGLDEHEIVEALRYELDSCAPRPETRIFQQFEVGDPAKAPSRRIGWLAFVLVIGIVSLGMALWKSYYWPSTDLPSLFGQGDQGSGAATSQQQTAMRKDGIIAPNTPISGPVVFTALESGIWVKFYDGAGRQFLQKQLAKGESYTVPTEALAPKLWTGRPDALAITIGGQAFARLAEEQKIIKDVAVDAASLQARLLLNVEDRIATSSNGTKAVRRMPVARVRARRSATSSTLGEPPSPAISELPSTVAN